MSRHLGFRVTLLTLGLAMVVVLPAAADITMVARYTLIGGDTLTRASYYTNRRVRVTAPDGREFMFDRKSDSVTVIDHKTRSYWTGPREVADTLAAKIIARNREGVREMATRDPAAWYAMVEAFNDSIEVTRTLKQRKIANYECDQWIIEAGSYLKNERWIARSLDVADYGPELERVVMASVKDPLGRQLMRILVAARSKDGLTLSSRARFRTLGRSGNFGYDAIRVVSGEIPSRAWAIPDGYQPIEP